MNFQTVSVAEKVDSPSTLTKNPDGTYTEGPTELAGYYPGGTTPRPLLASAFDYVNAQLERMVDTIQQDGLASSTAIIITAKHGQSPQDPLQLKRINDGPIIDAINAAWTAQTGDQDNLIVAGTDDDLWQSYLSVKTQAAADFVKNYLWNHSATAVLYNNDGINRGTEQVAHSGLRRSTPVTRPPNLRRAVLGPPLSGRVRSRADRHGVHRRQQDRRARWRQPR